MPASFLSGDLFGDHELPALAHGCNCAGAMGKGIAVEFRTRFPRMYAEYRRRCTEETFALGDVFAWKEPGGPTIFNLGTQRTWRTRADLAAVEKALRTMIQLAEAAAIPRIGLPRIGAGLGRLPWETVRSLLGRLGDETAVELVVFESYEPAEPSSAGAAPTRHGPRSGSKKPRNR